MRSIVIDPYKQTVEEVHIADGEYTTLQEQVGVEEIESTGLGSGIKAFVDGMGLYRKNQRYWFFDIEGGRVLMAGRAVIVSLRGDGELTDLDPRARAQDLVIHWAGDAAGAEAVIQEGRVKRPTMALNGEPVWSWTPDQERLEGVRQPAAG